MFYASEFFILAGPFAPPLSLSILRYGAHEFHSLRISPDSTLPCPSRKTPR